MFSTANEPIITGRFRTLTAWFEWLADLWPDFSTAPTTTGIYPPFLFFALKGNYFLSFEQVHKGREEDFLSAAIRHDFARREREEWDGLFRGLAYVLAAVTVGAVFLRLPLTWEVFVFFFGGVGVVTILLAVAVAAAWTLWGKGKRWRRRRR
jgi:hypothetical protein